jgi:hypothetical protein
MGLAISQMICEKGTIGLTMNQSDLPFTEEGISPDLIINPHCIPKRMTVAQLVETLVGKVAAIQGMEADGTPFNEIDIEKVKDQLEKLGYERNATETMYCGLTGQKLKIPIFIGPTYYQRLKHLVMDKMHCLREDTTELLTLDGWKKYSELTKDDLIATLVDNQLVYEKPKEIWFYPDFNDKLYRISNSAIELDVTMNHRMWVSKSPNYESYDFEYAENIIGKERGYKKDAEWKALDYDFTSNDLKLTHTDSWIKFFGIWISSGRVIDSTVLINKHNVPSTLYSVLQMLNYDYEESDTEVIINNDDLANYLRPLNENKYLPAWCFKLSKTQSQLLVDSLQLDSNHYLTPNEKLADNFMQLCLHAGYTCNKVKEFNKNVIFNLQVIKTNINPIVNKNNSKDLQEEYTYDYAGPVFCVEVSSGVFMVRSNGKACWTGNSRAKGPINMLTRQACEGRSKDGGLKCGDHHFATKSTDYNSVLVYNKEIYC